MFTYIYIYTSICKIVCVYIHKSSECWENMCLFFKQKGIYIYIYIYSKGCINELMFLNMFPCLILSVMEPNL